MVFGFVESMRATILDRILEDSIKLHAIVAAIDIIVKKFKLFWIGKSSGNRPRPIKVVVGCESTVCTIIKASTRGLQSGLGGLLQSIYCT